MKAKQKNLDGSNLGFLQRVKNYFRFDSYQAIWKKEIIGGLSTFLAMAYILAVNPALVGNSPLEVGNKLAGTAAQYQGGLFLTTALSSFIGTLVMGLWARVPIAVAPGMGLNAFFAFNVAQSVGFDSALTVTILSGILYFIVVLTPARQKIAEMIPHNFKIAIGAAIGIFIAYLGLQQSGIIVKDMQVIPFPEGVVPPEDLPITQVINNPLLTKIGDFGQPLVITAVCLTILGLILHFGKVPGAIIINMLVGAVVVILICSGAVTSLDHNGNALSAKDALIGNYSDFGTFADVAKAGWVGFANVEMWKNPMTYIGVLSFLYMDFFDTTGSLIVIGRMVDFDKVEPKWVSKANQVDAICTFAGAAMGSTTVTTFVESTVGVASGGKTGFSALVTSLCFGLSIAAWPILQVFMPINGLQPITAPILIIVGAIMMSQIKDFEWEIFADIPTLFVTIIMMVLSNSIAHGLSFGMITFVLVNASLGGIQAIKHRKKVVNDLSMPIADVEKTTPVREFNYLKRVNWVCIVIAVISIAFIILEQGNTWGHWFN